MQKILELSREITITGMLTWIAHKLILVLHHLPHICLSWSHTKELLFEIPSAALKCTKVFNLSFIVGVCDRLLIFIGDCTLDNESDF